jgi:calcineurin-like phosphoesterase family protein
MTTFFTSDTHFSHVRIIESCARPFRDVEEMNRELVKRWNARVQPDDTVYHLGDFAFGPVANVGIFRAQLNGDVHIVCGNHDRRPKRMEAFFGPERAHTSLIVGVDGVQLFLSHRPYDPQHMDGDGPRIPPGMTPPVDYHLHGHVHTCWARRGSCINVGVDVRDFEPKTLQELLNA